MIKNFWKKLIDPTLNLIEKYSGKINGWAWSKRWRNREEGTGYQEDWATGYRKWKKKYESNRK
mgnify:CR=1 FL=1